LSGYDRNRWADGRMGRWAVRQVGFRDDFHDRFGTHVRQRIVLLISTEQDKIGRIEIALRYFDSHSFDAFFALTQPGGVDQTEWEAFDHRVGLDGVARRARDLRDDRSEERRV